VRTLLAVALCTCLASAEAAWGESAPAGKASTSTGTIKVTSPGATVSFYAADKPVSVTGGTPVEVPTGTYFTSVVTCTQAVEKDGKKETWSIRSVGLAEEKFAVKVAGGEVTTVHVGPPLVANIKVGKAYAVPATAANDPGVRYVRVDLDMMGQGGEIYRFFEKNGKEPSTPSLSFVDEQGKEIGQCNIEFG
jgi:hypothetical protein